MHNKPHVAWMLRQLTDRYGVPDGDRRVVVIDETYQVVFDAWYAVSIEERATGIVVYEDGQEREFVNDRWSRAAIDVMVQAWYDARVRRAQ